MWYGPARIILLVGILLIVTPNLLSPHAFAETTTWAKSYGGSEVDRQADIWQTSDEGYIVAGGNDDDAWLLKVDTEGNIEWQKVYGGSLADSANSVQQTSDSGYIFAGSTDSLGAGSGDLWVVKVDSDGNVANCEATDLVNDSERDTNNGTSSVEDTDSSVRNGSAIVEDLQFPPADTSASVGDSCDPSSKVFSHHLQLFEHGSDPSDGLIDLGDEVVALAETDDIAVFEVEFRWINPSGEVARSFVIGSINEPISSAQDSFTPNEMGTWTVEADFGNGQVLRKTLDISFFVVPESPIGVAALIMSSLAVLGGFMLLKRRSSSSNLPI